MKEIRPVIVHKKTRPVKSNLKQPKNTNPNTTNNNNNNIISEIKRPSTGQRQTSNADSGSEKKIYSSNNDYLSNNDRQTQLLNNSSQAQARPYSVDTKPGNDGRQQFQQNLSQSVNFMKNNYSIKNNPQTYGNQGSVNDSVNNQNTPTNPSKVVISPNIQSIINNNINNFYIQSPNEYDSNNSNSNANANTIIRKENNQNTNINSNSTYNF